MRLAMAVTGFVLASTLSAGPAVAAPEGSVVAAQSPRAIPNSYIVVLKDKAAKSSLTARYRGKVGHTFSRTVHGYEVETDAKTARQLAADPAVDYVQANLRHPANTTQPSPPSWGLDRIDRNLPILNSSYDYPSTADWVHVYIMDSGMRFDHQDFGGRAITGWDFVNPARDASDCTGHGTHVAGTAGGTTFGVAKGVRLVSLRVIDCDGWGTTAWDIAAADWVTTTAIRPAVVNMSYGNLDIDPAWETAIKNSVASGVTYVVSAGNGDINGEGVDACGATPGRIPEVITVGSTGNNDAKAKSSNYGPCVDIFAPGVGITSANHAGTTGSSVKSGTSMAAPHVTGAAALVLAAHPDYTPAQVRDTLVYSDPTVIPIGGAGAGSPNKLLFVRSGPLRATLSCVNPTGTWSCYGEPIGAVGPISQVYTPTGSGYCTVVKTISVKYKVTDSLGATASASRTFTCRPVCATGATISIPVCKANRLALSSRPPDEG